MQEEKIKKLQNKINTKIILNYIYCYLLTNDIKNIIVKYLYTFLYIHKFIKADNRQVKLFEFSYLRIN